MPHIQNEFFYWRVNYFNKITKTTFALLLHLNDCDRWLSRHSLSNHSKYEFHTTFNRALRLVHS